MMKRNIIQILWMVFLFCFLTGLMIWAIFIIEEMEFKISVFGIIAVVLAAFTSVLTVTINNRTAKQREYDLIILKEKQKVFEHFYNALFDSLSQVKKGQKGPSSKATKEMMNFKRGLMNWGSDRLIKKYLDYEDGIQEKETFSILKDGDKFLKELRKEMGYEVTNQVNLMSIILTPEARRELETMN